MVLNFKNKTTNTFWMADFVFVPGETTTQELTAEQEKKLKTALKSKSMKERVDKGLIVYEFLKEAPKEIEEVQEGLA